MGNNLKGTPSRSTKTNELSVVILGLDAAGKTSAVNWLQLGKPITTTPTFGANKVCFEYKKHNLAVSDVGGIT